jgi:hypothetical protein
MGRVIGGGGHGIVKSIVGALGNDTDVGRRSLASADSEKTRDGDGIS